MAQLQLVQVRETKDLEKFIGIVMPKDVQATLQYVYLDELEKQRALGNRPSQALIDGRKGGDLMLVKRRAQAFFANTERLIAAFTEAWAVLVSLTRIKTGRARASYALYHNGRPMGGESDIARVVRASAPGDTIQIVGPGVVYGRKLYWNPLGKPRRVRKKVAQSKHGSVITQIYSISAVPIHKRVQRLIQRKYPELYVSDQWVDSLAHGEPRGERWPAIAIWPKGRLQ